MVILIVFIVALIAAIIYAFSPVKKVQNTKKVVMSSNPIDCIRPKGTMGFEIGDSYAFCLSRFKHLGIQVDDNELVDGRKSGFIVFGRNLYNNIFEVRCRFEQGYLFSITIDVDYSKDGINDMFGILMSRICRVLGKEPSCEEFCKIMWSYENTDVILLKHLVPIIDKEKLLVQITFA